MRATYRVLGHLIAGLVVVQAAAIALWVFGFWHWIDDGNGHTATPQLADDRFEGVTALAVGINIHSFGAIAVALVAIILLIVSFFAKIEGGVRAALFVFLDVVLQWALAFVSFGVWSVGLLHGLNAFLLFGLGLMAAGVATKSIKGTSAPSTAATSAV